jgi:hypothetical protein
VQSEYVQQGGNHVADENVRDYVSMSFTPQYSNSLIRIHANFQIFQVGNSRADVFLKRAGGNLASGGTGSSEGTNKSSITFVYQESSPGTSPTTYSIAFRKEPGGVANVTGQRADLLIEEILLLP